MSPMEDKDRDRGSLEPAGGNAEGGRSCTSDTELVGIAADTGGGTVEKVAVGSMMGEGVAAGFHKELHGN